MRGVGIAVLGSPRQLREDEKGDMQLIADGLQLPEPSVDAGNSKDTLLHSFN